MHSAEPLHASGIESFDGTNPQLQVGVDGVFHQHGLVNTAQGVGQCLHGKGVCAGAGTNPEDVDIVFQRQLHMLGCCHLGSNIHASLFLHELQPRQCLFAVTLEAAGLRARFPHTGTEVVAPEFLQLAGSGHHLLLGLCGARSCNDKRTFIVGRKIQFL